mmetsp:Transcript_56563/g.177640  ORF Transcript_56563/g.177640 Transcript_56563/m.177640 type:complete len:530 (+) Transcript_56563:86-1675(+)
MSSCLPGLPSALRTPPLVLVLGDGDLGYSAALCASGAVPPCRLIATTLEAEEDLQRRYARTGAHLESLRQAGALVLHGVDATSLAETLLPRLPLPEGVGPGIFSLARFNFPHCRGGLKSFRNLLGSTMASVAPMLAPGGEFEVALLAGQGGTPADGEQLRAWGDSWHCPLLGARAGLALVRVDSWAAPSGYVSQREPGNRDSGGREKSFFTGGSLVHVFAPRERASFPSSAGPSATRGGRPEAEPAPRLLDACGSLQDALRRELPRHEERLTCCQLTVAPGSRARFGPSDPASFGAVRLGGLQAAAGSEELARRALEAAVRATAHSEAARAATWRWTAAGEEAGEQLEVYWERPPCTACFPSWTASQPGGDWLVVAWMNHHPEGSRGSSARNATVDLEVLSMLRCDVHDRRLVTDSGGQLPAGGEGVRPRPVLYPCLYVHDLRARASGARPPDPDRDPLAAAVVRELLAACGGLLLEAFELPGEGLPEGERRWRLMLQSPDLVLDDRGAYAAFQASRERVREHLSLELR